MILHGATIGTLDPALENPQKDLYQQNHHMLVAQAQVMATCHRLFPMAKIGPAPNIAYVYAATCKPRDVIAAADYNALRNCCLLYTSRCV